MDEELNEMAKRIAESLLKGKRAMEFCQQHRLQPVPGKDGSLITFVGGRQLTEEEQTQLAQLIPTGLLYEIAVGLKPFTLETVAQIMARDGDPEKPVLSGIQIDHEHKHLTIDLNGLPLSSTSIKGIKEVLAWDGYMKSWEIRENEQRINYFEVEEASQTAVVADPKPSQKPAREQVIQDDEVLNLKIGLNETEKEDCMDTLKRLGLA